MRLRERERYRVPDDNPVACCLSDAELRQREATLLAQFKSALTATEELPDGYAFRIPGEKRWLALVADLILLDLSTDCRAVPISAGSTGQ